MNPTNDHNIAIIGPTVNQCYSATATEARAIADACDEAAEEQLRGRIDKEKLQGTCAPCGCACAPDVAPPEPTPGERAMEIRVKELEDARDELRATIEAMNEWYASELAKVRRQRDASLAERDENIAMRMNAIDQRADTSMKPPSKSNHSGGMPVGTVIQSYEAPVEGRRIEKNLSVLGARAGLQHLHQGPPHLPCSGR